MVQDKMKAVISMWPLAVFSSTHSAVLTLLLEVFQ